MKDDDVIAVADRIHEALQACEDETQLAKIRGKVFAFNADFPLPW